MGLLTFAALAVPATDQNQEEGLIKANLVSIQVESPYWDRIPAKRRSCAWRETGRKDLQVLVDSCESLFTATRVQFFFSLL